MKRLLFVVLGLLLTSCSAGGGSLSAGGAKAHCFWPAAGVDKYQEVVYPAGPEGKLTMSVK